MVETPRRTADVSIDVANVSKAYRVYDRPINRLRQALELRGQWLSRRLGLRTAPRQYFEEFWALDGVSFSVRKGECLGVLGRNGAGKSTLLEIIAGTVTPSTGGVWVNGRIGALLELGSGFSRDFTGRENVMLSASLVGLSRQEIQAKLQAIFDFAEIGDFVDRPVKTYSSGMLLRLAFSVYVALDPAVLIVDEALAVGDARFQKKCYDRIDTFRRQGGTVLFVTHDMHAVVQLCDRAMILERGRIYGSGKPQTIVREYHRLLFDVPVQGSLPNVAGQTKEGVDGQSPNQTDFPDQLSALKSGEVRYGSGRAIITSIESRDSSHTASKTHSIGSTADFVMSVLYRADINEQVAYGFIISNARGIEVYGTKSGLQDSYLPAGVSGSAFECTLRVPLTMAPGVYFLTAALAPGHPGEHGEAFFDCRFDALEFEIVGTPRCFTTSIVDLNGQLSHATVGSNPHTN